MKKKQEYEFHEGDEVVLSGPDLRDDEARADFSYGFCKQMQSMVGEIVKITNLEPYGDGQCFIVKDGKHSWIWDARYATPVEVVYKGQIPGQLSIEDFGLVVS